MSDAKTMIEVDDWSVLADRLSLGRDLTDWARSAGAFERSRRIRDGETLLRLVLAWAVGGKSLRQVALWAASEGMVDLTDEALVKRFGKCGPWLAEMMAARLDIPLSQEVNRQMAPGMGRQLRIIDGSTIGAPGACKPVWRLLLSFDPAAQRTLGAEVVPASCGELALCERAVAGDVVIADRNFARPESLLAIVRREADFVARLGSRSVRLIDANGQIVKLADLCRTASKRGPIDRLFRLAHGRRKDWQPLPVRLIIRPMPNALAWRNRQKLARAGQREGYTPSTDAEAIAGCLVLLTTLTAETADDVQALYRLRWQVELAFKRLKSLGNLDRLPARSVPLAHTWLMANLLSALMVEDVTRDILDSPPLCSHIRRRAQCRSGKSRLISFIASGPRSSDPTGSVISSTGLPASSDIWPMHPGRGGGRLRCS